MFEKTLKKLSDGILKSENGALYMLKTLSVLAIFQMVYSVFFYPQNYTATVEIFGGGCMTATIAVVCYFFAVKLKDKNRK
jgi:hypothetical protein